MNSFFLVLSRAALVFSIFSGFLFRDPNDLSRKIQLVLSRKEVRIPRIQFKSPSLEGENLYELGEYGKSIAAFKKSGVFGRFRANKISSQLEELNMPIRKGVVYHEGVPHLSQQRVLFYLTNARPFTNSGYTERTQFILSKLQDSGMSVEGVTRLGYPVIIGKIPWKNFAVVSGIKYNFLLPSLYPLNKERQVELAVRFLVDKARDFGATVLHTTTEYKNAIVVSQAAEILGIPWIYETRGELEKTWLSKRPLSNMKQAMASEFFQKSRSKETQAMMKASAVVALSEVSKEQAIRRGVPNGRITVVPNAIEDDVIERQFSKSRLRRELGLTDKKLVGAISSLVGYEGLDDLIKAMTLIKGVECIIVGEGESRKGLEDLALRLGLDKRIHFMGKQPSSTIWKWYAALDVFVVPRKDYEVTRSVTPIKTLMAQGLGVPVVASDLPALREVTGGIAVYSKPEDPASLASAISSIVGANSDQLEDFSAKGREWVETRTWRHNVETLRGVYRQVTQI